MPLLLEFLQLDLEFALQQLLRPLRAALQNLAHAKELRLVVLDHARRRRQIRLAAGEHVKLLDDFLRLAALRQMDEDFHRVRRVVVDVLDLDLALRVRREDRLDQRLRRRPERQLRDRQQILAPHLDLRAHLHLPAALAIVVFREIRDAARRKVRINPKRLPLQVIDRRPAKIVEIMRQDLRRQADRDALRAFQQHDRELRRQRHRLPRAPVVAQLPRRRLRVEQHVLRKIRQPRFDVTRRRRIVPRQEVSVVALRLDQKRPLPDRHQRGADRRIAVRMQRHRATHHIRDFVKPPVVHVPQRVENAPLHRLEAVVDVRHRAIENHIARVFEKPAAITHRQRRILVLHLLSTPPRHHDRRQTPLRLRRLHSVFRPLSSVLRFPPSVLRLPASGVRVRRRRAIERQFRLIVVLSGFFLGHRRRLSRRFGPRNRTRQAVYLPLKRPASVPRGGPSALRKNSGQISFRILNVLHPPASFSMCVRCYVLFSVVHSL